MNDRQTQVMTDFLFWYDGAKMEMDAVLELMSESLSENVEAMIGEMRTVEAWYARIGVLHSDANKHLKSASEVFLPSKEGRSEMERKLGLEASVSAVQFVVDQLKHLLDSIRQRIILGESILSFRKQFPENGNG